MMANTGFDKRLLLTINGGSSSIKFSVYEISETLSFLCSGEIENIGTGDACFHVSETATSSKKNLSLAAVDQTAAAQFLISWLEKQYGLDAIAAIGHRVVHGMHHTKPEKVTPALIKDLREISSFDPEHLPGEIALIELFIKHFPRQLQVACFDTSFHTAMPAVAKLLAIPRRFITAGLQRYGFHGLSYAWMMEELQRRVGVEAVKGKIVLAHLGNGASIAAVKEGKSVDTSMGFTPAAGLPMGTRTGDLDPGVAWYMMKAENLSPAQFNHLINHESGLLGISGTVADMRVLLKAAPTDGQAAAAVEFFCYQAKKWIGAYAAAMGGIDILVFSGGIGQHSPEIRQRICTGLDFLRIAVDEDLNGKNAPVISTGKNRVAIHVIAANEELMIAKLTAQVLKETSTNN